MANGALRVRSETWTGGDTPLARNVARPLVRFLAQETASGVLLLVATAAALVWVNSPWGESYHHFWDTHLAITLGDISLIDLSIHGWVNDALMALFFFVVGMEIKSELVAGDLRDPRVAALPAIAALGGMLVPALIYFLVNAGTDTVHGWGVPMATDIAFAVGVLALLGDRVPPPLKLFLLTLAIVDDIGAIAVIAVFYTSQLNMIWMALAAVGIVLIVVLQRLHVWYIPVYAVIGTAVWYATYRSGVHATIAGVILGLLTPARPLLGPRMFERIEDILSGDDADPVAIRNANWQLRERVPVTSRLITVLSPWTSFLVIPAFALANAGVALSGDAISAAVASSVTWGVLLGLVIGKPIGVFTFSMLATRSGVASMPAGLKPRHLLGGGAVAGIGFTVALFISTLAFERPEVVEDAVIGILSASVLATLIGYVLLGWAHRVDLAEAEVPAAAES
ncbi:MAG: Na+/H+ antiporter NhaA [Acidimicrobiales bacterium]